jgi:hypothetical protein
MQEQTNKDKKPVQIDKKALELLKKAKEKALKLSQIIKKDEDSN